MEVSAPTLRSLSARLGDRRRAQRAGASERRGPARSVAGEASTVEASATLDFDALAELGGWVDGASIDRQRHAPAELLYALIEQMGGMPSSRWKGMHVNLVV